MTSIGSLVLMTPVDNGPNMTPKLGPNPFFLVLPVAGLNLRN